MYRILFALTDFAEIWLFAIRCPIVSVEFLLKFDVVCWSYGNVYMGYFFPNTVY